jgi:hypothetical protein
MRPPGRCAFEIGLLVTLLIGSVAVQPGFSKGGRGAGHVYGKSAARPSESGARQALRGDNIQGPAKADVAHTAVTRYADKPSDIDTRITVQPRRLGKSVTPNTGNAKPAQTSLARSQYRPRTLSALPRAPTPPVRNAIGLPISPRGSFGPGNGLHPNSLFASRSFVSPAVPNGATGRLAGIGGAVERVPHFTPNFVSPGASRGAISGTGLTARRQGLTQIGGPKSVVGINGTTMKPAR